MRNAFLVLGILLVSGRPPEAQVLKYIETSKPDILNPVAGARSVVGVRILELVFRGLLSQDREGEWLVLQLRRPPVHCLRLREAAHPPPDLVGKRHQQLLSTQEL